MLKKELNRSGWTRKGGLWSKKGTDISGLTLAQAKEAAGIKKI